MNDKEERIANLLTRIREQKPLVHHITNPVVMNDTANITLAIGALPVMANAPEEVEEMVSRAQALVLNLGMLNSTQLESMLRAGQRVNERGTPIVLDPVGVGATSFRTQAALRLLSTLRITVLRGNASEIGALIGVAGETRGVESISVAADRAALAHSAARALQCTVAVTGVYDMVTDGERLIRVDNGHPLLAAITGSGCMATSLVGACLAVETDPLFAALVALVTMGLAAEHAATRSHGPGTFRAHLLDAVAALDGATVAEGQKVSFLS